MPRHDHVSTKVESEVLPNHEKDGVPSGRPSVRSRRRAPRAQRRPRGTHRARRHQERELLSLYEPAAGHPVAAASERVRRHDRVLRAGPAHAAVAKPDDRKAYRPHRRGAPGALIQKLLTTPKSFTRDAHAEPTGQTILPTLLQN